MTSQFTKLTHHQHSGELEVQRFQGVPSSMPPELVSDEMPKQHSDFFSNLQYFAIGTTDSQGRPWSTILSSQTGFIHALSSTKLSISCLVAREDPFLRAVEEHEKQKGGKKLLFAGLGVDFTNRRRNKVAGVILKAQVTPSSPSLSRLEMILFTNENMGNCPKYITTRTLEYFPNDPNLESRTLSSNEVLLDSSCQDIISQASTVFLVTRHLEGEDGSTNESDLGLNHRGGMPGFVRVEQQEKTTHLFLPDFSGNRFYQSLGNIQSDNVAGLVFPNFKTGDTLHITGKATNLFNNDAHNLLPRSSLVTRIQITGYTLLRRSLHLSLTSPEKLSPYNPPLRYLSSELEKMGRGGYLKAGEGGEGGEGGGERVGATIVSIKEVSELVKLFTFRLERSVKGPKGWGGYAIFDFKKSLRVPYMHMNPGMPQLVNDDLIRTWTISSSSLSTPPSPTHHINEITCAIKLVPEGVVTPYLHSLKKPGLKAWLVGVGGGFFKGGNEGEGERKGGVSSLDISPSLPLPSKMLWVAGGIGITPFLSFFHFLCSSSFASSDLPKKMDIAFLFSCRDDDLSLLFNLFLSHSTSSSLPSLPTGITFQGKVFHTSSSSFSSSSSYLEFEKKKRGMEERGWEFFDRRVEREDVWVEGLQEREVFMCGPKGLEGRVVEWVEGGGVEGREIHRENFDF